MKKINCILVLFIIFTSILSCSSDDDVNISTNDDYYLRYKLDGNAIEYTDIFVANSLSKTLGGDGTDSFIRLFVPLDVTTGSYSISSFVNDDFTASYNNDTTSSESESGTITITEVNAAVISGSFSFTGIIDGLAFSITEGEFRLENIE